MENEEILLESKALKCKFIIYSIYLSITLTPIVVALIFWYYQTFFISFAIFLTLTFFSFIIMSKLRNEAIPSKQREFNYSNLNIIKWYVKYILFCD